ncbi:MAG: type VII secretion-associated protein, partial [Mycobacterium sp.]
MSEVIATALGAVDDQVALVGERPVAVDLLWSAALRSVHCAHCNGLVLVYPSWWSPSRVGMVTAAAATVADDVLVRPRSWLLTQASDAEPEATMVVEISERLVVIAGAGTGAEAVAVPRRAEPQLVAEEVADTLAGMVAAVVLIDAPSTVAGAPALATLIADAVPRSGQTVLYIDDARLARLAQSALSAVSAQAEPSEPLSTACAGGVRSRARTLSTLGAAAIVVAAAAPAVVTAG